MKKAQSWRIKNGIKASKHKKGWRYSNPTMFIKTDGDSEWYLACRRSSLHA